MERDLEAEEPRAETAGEEAQRRRDGILSALRALGYTLFLLTTADADAGDRREAGAPTPSPERKRRRARARR